MKSLYLILHLATISYPLAQSFEKRIQYVKKWKALFPAILITGVFFIAWDMVFTRNGVWGFNPDYYIGLRIGELPLEEWLFFVTVPFASVFIYECVIYFFPSIKTSRGLAWGTGIFSLLLILIAAFNYQKAYTFWNFLFAAAFLLSTAISNPPWLGHFWTAYFIHLIPFLVVNGILTGTFIDEPVVWYNNTENLSIRIFTIPIEDTIYALLLLLMNVTFFERLNNYFRLRT